MRKTLWFLLVGLSFVAVSCGDNTPTEYNEQVQDSYMSGCRVALNDPQFDNVDAVCRCAYERISAQMPFEDFAALNNRLKNDVKLLENPDEQATQALKIVSDCILSVPLGT